MVLRFEIRQYTGDRFGNDLAEGYAICGEIQLGGNVSLNKCEYDQIPGTIVFDGRQAMKGYALNKMCFSFNSPENREAYARNEDAYCAKFNLTDEQRQALKQRNVLALLRAGGNIYYLAKWGGIFGLNVQQIGAQQTGMTEEQFKEMLVCAGKE
jgi:protocatechuate 4,5-dioxygenase, alpha chain